jgi:predicted transcriptional regulator
MTHVEDVFNTISDDKSLTIFKIISLAKGERAKTSDILSQTKLTRRQYYSRMFDLVNTGLVERRKNIGKYVITSFGEQIYRGQRIIEDALNIFWKLKALDAIALSDKSTEEEIIDSLIDNEEIKEILKKTKNNSFDLLYLSKNYISVTNFSNNNGDSFGHLLTLALERTFQIQLGYFPLRFIYLIEGKLGLLKVLALRSNKICMIKDRDTILIRYL